MSFFKTPDIQAPAPPPPPPNPPLLASDSVQAAGQAARAAAAAAAGSQGYAGTVKTSSQGTGEPATTTKPGKALLGE